MAVGIFASIANDEVAKAVAALQADIAVLREENAQLRVARQRPGAAGSLASLRTIVAGADHEVVDHSSADATWQTLTDVLVMRDVLLEMCAQIQSLAGQMQQRLERLGTAPATSTESATTQAPE